ncbi:hypothetical protein SAMN05428981_1107 [Bacillus sp. OV194]|nr:hypothetical protein SAMN05428981_1107 [Bacillus sp. OV194]
MEKKYKDLSAKIDSYETKNTELKSKNEILLQENKSLNKTNESLEVANEKIENELDYITSNPTDYDQTSSATEYDGSDTLYDATTSDGEDPIEDAEINESCDIKGSENGIYHVPGSTYYSRTTNVVEWFCSTAEAEEAGYRAPFK